MSDYSDNVLNNDYTMKPYSSPANSMAPFATTPASQSIFTRDPNQLPSADANAGNQGFYRSSNRQAYDRPAMLGRIQQGVDSQSNLMGPSSDQSPEDQALSARASQFYNSSLTKLARNAIPQSIAMTSKLQGQDITNRSAIYADMQSRAAINYKEAIMEREKALGVAMMQRDLYGSLFGGLSKIGGSVAAAALTTPSGSGSVYQPNVASDQQWASYTGADQAGSQYPSTGGDSFVGPPNPYEGFQ